MDVHGSKNLLFLFPGCYDVVLQQLSSLKNRNAKELSGLKPLAIWQIGTSLDKFPAPNSIQSSFKGTSWRKSATIIMTMSLSAVLIIAPVCSFQASFTWTKILSAASSILYSTKDDISRPASLVTTFSFIVDTTTLLCISFTTTFDK